MAKRGGTALKGAAAHGEAADPSLKIITERLEALERTVRLQEQQLKAAQDENAKLAEMLRQAVEDKQRAIEGMEAAQAELMKLREKPALSKAEEAAMLREVERTASEIAAAKRQRFQEIVAKSPLAAINNPGPPIMLQVNGVAITVPHGRSEIPSPFLHAWEAYLEDNAEAARRSALIQGGNVSFGTVEDWIYRSRGG